MSSATLPTQDKDVKVKDAATPLGVVATRRTAANEMSLLQISRILPNPDSIMRRAGRDPIPAYREIEEDTNVSSYISSRRSAVKKLIPTIDHDRPQTVFTEFAKDLISRLPIRNIIGNILEAPMYGYAVLEVMWRYMNDKLIPVAVVDRPQEWFGFDEDGVPVFKSKDHPDGETLEYRKFIVIRHEATTANPYGKPILSKCFWPASFKKSGFKLYLRFIDKYGIPHLIGKGGRGVVDDKEQDDILDMLDQIRQDGVGVIPEDWNITALDLTGSTSASLFLGLRQACKEDIIEAILGHIGAAQSTAGQLGQNDTALQVRQDIVDADKMMVEDAINQLIKWAIDLNFYTDDYPVFTLEEPAKVRKELADRDKTLLEGKTFLFSKEYYMRTYGFKDSDIVMLPNGGADAPLPAPATPPVIPPTPPIIPAPPKFDETPKAGQTHLIAQTAVDDVVDAHMASLQEHEAFDAMIIPVVKKVLTSNSFQDAFDVLTSIYPDMDNTQFEERLQRALEMADLIGRLEMEETLRLKGGKA